MKALNYIRERLSEAGTMRSLVVVIVGLQMGVTADALIEALTGVALVALGAISAAMPEKKP
jgi:hypothetical protein